MQTFAVNPSEILNQAEALLQNEQDSEAQILYERLLPNPGFSPVAYFRLGEVFNRFKQIDKSYEAHRMSFDTCPELLKKIVPKDFKHYPYIYKTPDCIETPDCPLCARKGKSHSCYNTATYLDFTPGFDPVRLWLYCSSCHHIFASSRPRNISNILANTSMGTIASPDPGTLIALGKTLKALKKIAPGKRLLEVGAGAGELTAVAQELQLEVSALEIRHDLAKMISRLFGVKVDSLDFLEFHSQNQVDIICMGDVLEHFLDPVAAIKKARELLTENGILWISTPNFDSAYCRILKDRDPMWKVCEHLNFFSRQSLINLLSRFNFEILDYSLSASYRGSMEITARKLVK
jgi:2-polyprenyl-3-methyl-5-hydroxy-6-metoxy-1,4-benzoquinol methylase